MCTGRSANVYRWAASRTASGWAPVTDAGGAVPLEQSLAVALLSEALLDEHLDVPPGDRILVSKEFEVHMAF